MSPPTACPVARVFEVDDLLGKIYSSIEDPADRRAFRHSTSSTYRSPSINSQITQLFLEPVTLESAQQETAAKVAAFPRHAAIRSLTLTAGDSSMLSAMFHAIQASTSARPRLQSVRAAALSPCNLTPDLAIEVSSLLPSLRKLVMLLGTCDDNTMGVLAAQLPGLEDLVLAGLEVEGQGDFVSRLAAFPSLRKLDLVMSSSFTTVRPLAAVTGLQSLSLGGYETLAEGLDAVLERTPLQFLCCKGVLFPSPAPRLRSSTLKRLHLSINASCPRLSAQDFPQLEMLTVAGIDMFGEDLSALFGLDDEQLRGLEQVVRGLASGFPLDTPVSESAPIFYESQSKGPRRTFMLTCETGTRPASTYLALLKLLEAVPALLRTVERLIVGYYEVCAEGLQLTSRLFAGAEHVFLSGGYVGDRISDLLMMPRLQQMCLQVVEPPRDVISTLTQALLAGRHLVLDLNCFEDGEFLQALKHQWEDMRASVPAARSVVLRVSQALS